MALLALLIAGYAVASKVEFEVGIGSAIPTQLVFVPMLFLLPPAMVPRLGDPFLTARRAADRTGGAEGMGLGLFIARTLLERSGAAVAFGNGEGGGARVEVTWPRGALAADARAPLGDNPAITG